MKNTEVITRAIILNEDAILLCKSNEQGHYFLPGGHVEFSESAEETLVREMKEEANAELTNMEFAGLFENTFGENEEKRHEINILYTANVQDENITSQEEHLSFEWVALDQLGVVKFLPQVFGQKILEYIKSKEIVYLSTLE